ncbi:MAG: hypothetical protein ACK55I_11850, partial [bacterium]
SGMGAKREETVTLFPAIVACTCLLAAIKALMLFCASEWVDLMAGDNPWTTGKINCASGLGVNF